MARGRCNPSTFSYFGSKRNVANLIGSGIDPQRRPYCEPFTGGGNVVLYLASVGQLRQVWLNDLDVGVAAIWSCLARGWHCLVADTLPKVFTRKTYEDTFHHMARLRFDVEAADQATLIDAARSKLLLLWSSYSSICTCVGNYDPSRWPSQRYMRSCLSQGGRLLAGLDVRVTNKLFQEVIPAAADYDLYIDPPYYEITGGYACDFKHCHHLALHDLLSNRPNRRWLLSYDDHPVIRHWYRWAEVKEFRVPYSSGKGRRIGVELLIRPKEG